ncbi:MAG: DUF6675 family protein [Spirochaetota bacterium]
MKNPAKATRTLIMAFLVLPLLHLGAEPEVTGSIRNLPVYDLDSLFPHLSEEDLEALRGDGKITAFTNPGYSVDLGPRIWTVEDVAESLEELDPAFALESVYLIPIQDQIREAEDPELFIYNVLRSISTMEGLQYYSHTREKWRELFHESMVVAEPDSRTPIPDPTVESVPGHDEIYAYQHDSSFGKNTYTVTYRYAEGAYFLRLINISRIRYLGMVPVVSRESMHVYVSVAATDEGLVFYGHAAVDVLTTLGLEARLRRSFENRVEAIFTWFQDQVEERGPTAFLKPAGL